MSEKQDNNITIRVSQVIAAALAAVTAAVLGSTMGVAGTVVGAGLASVVSTVGGAIYLRSIQRTQEGVRTVHARTVRKKAVARSGTTSILVSDDSERPAAEPESAESTDATDSTEPETPDEQTRPPREPRRLSWPALIAGSVVAFVLGMLVITGVEWIRGESLSGGNGTTVGDLVVPQPGQEQRSDDRAPDQVPTVPPPTSTDPTGTSSQPPPTTSSEPSDSSTPPTTSGESSTPPTTTTTDGQPSETVPPPSPPAG